ncbi:hypothetical protein BN1708_009816 [Verticillium longisporum]|uniref:Retroviral polymerase SH3-like domain-containing protein n=1 Tax=Verticillium longisporum TaxID=100787 RepID=A0A0G4KL46_VERLO|nr:hypothetical protein BN1708_009816 [Verticillium longisporum]
MDSAVATSYEAWDLVDPDKEADRRPKRAKKPTAPSFEDETRDLSTLLTLYKIHLDIYNRESAGLQEVQKYILNTVDRSLSAVFMNEESSQEWLKALKDHFAPSDMGQKQYIRQRWEEHMAMIKKMDHEKWVDDFILLCIEVEKHGIPQLKEAADQNVQFLRAILSVSPGWAEAEDYQPHRLTTKPSQTSFYSDSQKRAPKACQPICLCPNIAEHRRKKSYQSDQSLLDYIDEAKKRMKPSTLQFWNEKIKEDKKKRQEARGTSGVAVSAFNNFLGDDDEQSCDDEYTNFMSNFSVADSDEFQRTNRGGDLRHEFLIDSGTPNHITNNKDLLTNFREATDTNVISITCHDVSNMLFNPATGSEIPLQEKGGHDSRLWHERLAHAHPEAIQQLPYSSKSKKIVSRRQPTYTTTNPFERVNLDFFSPGKSYNGMESCLVITDAYSGKIVVRILPARADGFQAFINFEMFLWRQYHLVIKVLRVDWDSALRSNLNGAAERNGGTIFTIARTLTSAAGFPEDLWPEVWATPEGRLNDWLNSKGLAARTTAPGLAHLRRYGCRAYPLTADAQEGRNRKQKLAPRAHIGYLCGYDSSNIYRIWAPEMKAVLRTRDDEFQALDVPVADAQNPFNSSLDIDEFDVATIDLFEKARTFQLGGKINAEILRPREGHTASRDDVLPSPRPTPETETGQGQPAVSEGVEDAVIDTIQGAEDAVEDTIPVPDTIQVTEEAIEDTIEWLEASVQEVNTIENMDTIEQVPFESVDQEIHKVLGLTWVWKYKVDSAGYVTKFKARLCGKVSVDWKHQNFVQLLNMEQTQFLRHPGANTTIAVHVGRADASGRNSSLGIQPQYVLSAEQTGKHSLPYLAKFVNDPDFKGMVRVEVADVNWKDRRTHVLAEQLAVTVWTTVMVDTSVDTTVATTVRPVDGTTLDAMLTWKSDDDDDDAAGGTLACAPGVVCPSRGAPADGVDAPAGACPVLVDVWLAVGDACNPVEDVADASDPDPDNIAPVGGAPSDSGADPSVLVLVIALLEPGVLPEPGALLEPGVLPEPGTLLEPGALLNATRKSVVVCVTSVGTVETNVVDDRTIVASVLRVTTDSDTHPIRPTFTSGRWGSPRPPAIVA